MNFIRRKFATAALTAAVASVLAFAPGAKGQDWNHHPDSDDNQQANDNPWPYATPDKSPVLAVVGDISCQPGTEASGESSKEVCTDAKAPYTSTSLYQSQEATANQIETIKPDAVALLGDLQYQVGRYSDFEQSFDLTYGAFKFLQRPAPGNHEFYDEHGQTGVAGYGYFSYFNGFLIDTANDANLGQPVTTTISDPCPSNPACGPGSTPTIDLTPQPIPRADGQAGHFEEQTGVGDGWYSYNLGGWHLISLNIECSTQPGGCSNTGAWFAAELAWLKKDLEENHSACTLAYWHQPSYSAADSLTPEGTTALAFWQLLYQYNADLVLNGHDHLYARYRPVNPSGKYDPKKGIREFIVGTGGETLDTVVTTGTDAGAIFNAANIEAATGNYWGVMALTLDPNGYKWDFESALPMVSGAAPYFDKGAGTCHGGNQFGW